MRNGPANFSCGKFCLALAALFAISACQAATINFQGRSYNVTVVALPVTVPVSGVCDLIFVQVPTGEKFLMIPSDATARGDFDIDAAKQRFYMLDRNTGNVVSFTSIDGTLINLDGTFFSTTVQNPGFGQNPLETITRPLIISSQENPVDPCIISAELLGYRTDGPVDGRQKIYSITRESGSSVSAQFLTTLKNADPANNNINAFVEYDADTTNFLTLQISLDVTLNTDIRDRISAFSSDGNGTLVSEIVLESNTAFPNFSGSCAGIAADPTTGTIYVLDSGARQIFVITPRKPAISKISPNNGPTSGGTSVTISGVNLPGDAAVFIDGIAATGVTVSGSGNSITATTPAHAVGTVTVTVTGTGIPANAPLTLSNAFSYVNTPPNVVLLASPTQGLPPLEVSFNLTGTGDTDGTLTSLVLDFGDGNSSTLPADVSLLTVSHTYIAQGTYTATLTATDNQGGSKKATQVIIVGQGADLTLRALTFKSDSKIGTNAKETFKLTGELVLPDNISLSEAQLTVAFVNPVDGALTLCPDLNQFVSAINGGQFCARLNTSGYFRGVFMNFKTKALKKLSLPPNTYTFTFSAKVSDLDPQLNEALVNANGEPALPALDKNSHVGKVVIVVRLKTAAAQELQYVKVAVVQIKSSKSSKVQLDRQ
jgi:PKD repeat protein